MCVFGLGGELCANPDLARELLWCSRKLGTVARCRCARRQAVFLRGWLARAHTTARSQGTPGGAYYNDSPYPGFWSRPTKVHCFPSGRGKVHCPGGLASRDALTPATGSKPHRTGMGSELHDTAWEAEADDYLESTSLCLFSEG